MQSELVYGLSWRQAAAYARAHPDSEYVEGGGSPRTAVAHAWCGDRNGTIHEPTWPGRVPAQYLGVAVRPRVDGKPRLSLSQLDAMRTRLDTRPR